MNPWLWSRTLRETHAAGLDPLGTGLRQRDARLAALLAAAFGDSPFYRRRRRGAGGDLPRLDQVAPVEKAELMQHFDAWATDRQISRAGVDAFLREPAHLADAYLGRYLVWTSSGTTGEPGIFVQSCRPSSARTSARHSAAACTTTTARRSSMRWPGNAPKAACS
jgi:phenylacetate-CoA ligase